MKRERREEQRDEVRERVKERNWRGGPGREKSQGEAVENKSSTHKLTRTQTEWEEKGECL